MLLFALAIAPGLAIMLYIYRQDSYNREPRRYLLFSFLLGLLSVVPAIILQLAAAYFVGHIEGVSSVAFYACYAFIIIACSEEGSKFFMVWKYAYRKRSFDEPFDGIVYTVMVAMGFATAENILYVEQHGLGTAVVRMFLSVPAHAAFGVIMGYYLGLAKFNGEKQKHYLLKGYLLAVFFHGAFDFFLMLKDNVRIKAIAGQGLLLTGALASWAVAMRLSLRAIRLHRERSRVETERQLRDTNQLL